MTTKNVEKRTTPVETPFWDRYFTPGKVGRSGADRAVHADKVPRPVVVSAKEFARPHTYPRHHHDRAQLVYASRGVMEVVTESGLWVVPPQRAVWVPSGMDHEVRSRGPLSMRNVYFRADAINADHLPTECCVVTVSALLRELILDAAERPLLYDEHGPDDRRMAVIVDEIQALAAAPLHLPLPTGRRLQRVTRALADDPSDRRSLAQWALVAATSTRTLARLFVKETGLTFGQWRQQMRLLESLRRLAEGDTVTTIAMDLGYGSQSAFIAMFKRALGRTPRKYFGD